MFISTLIRRGRFIAAVGLAFAGAAAFAQPAYPVRPITLVSPFLAGSSADGIARVLVEIASKEIGQPIVLEPKPGAEALIAMMDVLKAQPDGYRLLWAGGGSLMGVPAMRKNPPFDPANDFTPIAGSVDFSFFLYVHPSFPAKTAKEFVAYVKANPGKVAYATGNVQGRMSMADIARRHSLEMLQVQYKGELAAGVDLMTNRVQAMWGTTSLLNVAREGKLRIISTSLPRRSPLLPQIPTLRDEGVAGAEFSGGWLSVVGPAKMPKPIVEKLNKAFVAALNHPQAQARMLEAGLIYTPHDTAEELYKFMVYERDLYRRTAQELDMVTE